MNRRLIGVAVVVVVVVIAGGAAVLLSGGNDTELSAEPSSTTLEQVARPVTSAQVTLEAEAAETSTTEDGCAPIPGTEVRAVGEVVSHAAGEEVNGRVVFGASAAAWFSIDGPHNDDLFSLDVIFTDGSVWSDTGSHESVSLSYDPGAQRLTGSFELSRIVDDLGNLGDPQPVTVDMAYDAPARTLVGTMVHPDETFEIDMTTEEAPRDYFDDPTCYPTPTDNPA